VLVGEQKIPSIRTLKLVCEALSRIDGPGKLHIVINRYDPRIPGFGVDRLKSLLEVDEITTVRNDYASVMASINHGRPLRKEAPRSPALADISQFVKSLVSPETRENGAGSAAKARRSGFGRFMKRIGLAAS
jgi:Flp pilus assembly CpaE family ATPase